MALWQSPLAMVDESLIRILCPLTGSGNCLGVKYSMVDEFLPRLSLSAGKCHGVIVSMVDRSLTELSLFIHSSSVDREPPRYDCLDGQ